ncbi:MAG: type IV toxin-antitoxin system AbiEi family antitoxin [Actinocrinis sp.]
MNKREVILGGVSAAPHVGADYLAPNRADLYVRPNMAELLAAEFGMTLDPRGGNVLIRIPPTEAWSFLESASSSDQLIRYAPPAVVAADLLDIHQDRARSAADRLLDRLAADVHRDLEKQR